MKQPDIIPHLFRNEFSKIASVIARQFGIEHLETAEDIASETFLAALETWSYKGVPDNPTAWLYAVAKNKTKNFVLRNKVSQKKVASLPLTHVEQADIDWSARNIFDSQLQMLFAICNPIIPIESQIAIALRILCGFGIEEIANAFLTNKEVINKRLFRAREKLRLEKIKIEYPGEVEIERRLDAVLTTLYLLFNEGYYSESYDQVLRKDLCLEAMRLIYLLHEYQTTNTPGVNALLALMCFHASRFDARESAQGELVLYDDQDESLWDKVLINKGAYYLKEASRGNEVTRYHIEASIGYWHTIKAGSLEKWSNILKLYDQLLLLECSPIAALNRAFAFSKVHGCVAAIAETEKLQLTNNHYYYTLLGELYWEIDGAKSKIYFQKALALAKTQPDKRTLEKKLEGLVNA